jgi:uncharacterized protein YdeI (YjbR/CyaY-like superfamily)
MPSNTSTPLPAEQVHPETRANWRAWLQRHHGRTTGVWLVTWKKATGRPRIEYDDTVEEALAWGWVDSKTGKLDGERSMLWFAPRKPRTGWSRPNQQRIERLLAQGLMQPAGQRKVDAAKADGSWSKLDAVEDGVIPPDLAAALAAHPPAAERFAAFPRSVRRGILEWIEQARRPETRQQRVLQTATLAQRNERANQWSGPKSARAASSPAPDR